METETTVERPRALLCVIGVGYLIVALMVVSCHRSGNDAARLSKDDRSTQDELRLDAQFKSKTVAGVLDAAVDLSRLDANCLGYVADVPTLHMLVEHDMPMELHASPIDDPEQDLMLAMRSPNGAFFCNDDGRGIDPLIQETLAPGMYTVWVGGRTQETTGRYELTVRHFRDVRPQGPAPKAIEEGSFGGLELPTAFGPAELKGRAGGTREASSIGPGCVGYIGMTPDHVLVLDQPSQVKLAATTVTGDLVLLVQDGFGQTFCNDDAHGKSPEIHERLDAGTWNVYVGSFVQNEYPEYELVISR